MKRIIVCCDGTWQSQDNKVATNVLKIAQAVSTKDQNEIDQTLYYDRGIGAVPDYKNQEEGREWNNFFFKTDDLIDETIIAAKRMVYPTQRMFGGIFGLGIEEKIEEAYIFLCLNYEPGDEIYMFGFSRGAYTIRSLAGLIDLCGLLQRPDINRTGEAYEIYRLRTNEQKQQEARDFRQKYEIEKPVQIKFLGCWDTVGALGIPNAIPWLPVDEHFKKNLKFHDNKLGSIIENARHAIAIDESRSTFEVTMMQTEENWEGSLKQVWFPGDHGCVGGGTDEIIKLPGGCELRTLDLSKTALKWMAEEAQQLGLDLDLAKASDRDLPEPNPRTIEVEPGLFQQERDLSKLYDRINSNDIVENFHESVMDLWCHQNYRPKNLEVVKDKLKERC